MWGKVVWGGGVCVYVCVWGGGGGGGGKGRERVVVGGGEPTRVVVGSVCRCVW